MKTSWKTIFRNRVLIVSLVTVSLTLAMVSQTGCISDQGTFNNVDISGYVRTISDSSSVPGALVIVNPSGDLNNHTDSNGYYEYHRTFPTGQGDPLELLVIVTDVDGVNNGVFVSKDTIIYEENTADNMNLVYEIDFYVEVVGDSTKSL